MAAIWAWYWKKKTEEGVRKRRKKMEIMIKKITKKQGLHNYTTKTVLQRMESSFLNQTLNIQDF